MQLDMSASLVPAIYLLVSCGCLQRSLLPQGGQTQSCPPAHASRRLGSAPETEHDIYSVFTMHQKPAWRPVSAATSQQCSQLSPPKQESRWPKSMHAWLE